MKFIVACNQEPSMQLIDLHYRIPFLEVSRDFYKQLETLIFLEASNTTESGNVVAITLLELLTVKYQSKR